MRIGKMMKYRVIVAVAITVAVLTSYASILADEGKAVQSSGWTDSFPLDRCEFSDTGQNEYFILEPGYTLFLKGVEDGDSVSLVITVLDETEEIDGVLTRVVEERESVGNELIEVSRNFFAFCQAYGSIFYFGEDVDIYEDGHIAGHEGAWRAGESGFSPGLMMPGLPLIGASYYQEIAPNVAMDRARITKTDTTIQTPSRIFEHCLVTEETSDLEPKTSEYKFYAPGVGLITDGNLWLVSAMTRDMVE
jgi:hypothetical protein